MGKSNAGAIGGNGESNCEENRVIVGNAELFEDNGETGSDNGEGNDGNCEVCGVQGEENSANAEGICAEIRMIAGGMRT